MAKPNSSLDYVPPRLSYQHVQINMAQIKAINSSYNKFAHLPVVPISDQGTASLECLKSFWLLYLFLQCTANQSSSTVHCKPSTSSTCTSHVHPHRQQSISTLTCSFKLPPKIILPLAAQHYIAIYPTQYIASAFDSFFSASYQPYFFTVPIL